MNRKLPINSVRYRIRTDKNGVQDFAALLLHPMEDGRRKDRKTGKPIPANYIETFSVSVDGVKYIEVSLGQNVSKNPLVSFAMAHPVTAGQKLEISWVDNHGMKMLHTSVIALNDDATFDFVDKQYYTAPPHKPYCKLKLRPPAVR